MKYYDFYNQYLDLPQKPKPKGFETVRCVLCEKDHDPSAGVDLSTGVFKCFKCGEYSAARFLTKIHTEMSIMEASAVVDSYRREKGIVQKYETFVNYLFTSPKWESIVRKAQAADLANIPMVRDYAGSRGLTIQTLINAGVGWIADAKFHRLPSNDGEKETKEVVGQGFVRPAIVFPYYVNGKIVGVRYRDDEGNKDGEEGCHFTLWGLDDIKPGITNTAIILEGESDRLRAKQIVDSREALEHCVVLSTPTGTFRLEWKRDLEGIQRIILVPQADAAAQKMIEKARAVCGDALEVYSLPWKRGQVGKDFCEWMQYHEEQEFVDDVESLLFGTSNKFMTGGEFKEYSAQPRSYVVDNLLARRQVTIIGGEPKQGKTWVALNLMRSTIVGDNFLGIPGLAGRKGMKWLIVEEEGDAEELRERVELVFGGEQWEPYTFWAHHMGCRLDEDAWIDRLSDRIRKYGVDGVILDPLQNMTSGEENSSTENKIVWRNLHKLTTRFKGLTPVVLHHFGKGKGVDEGGKALRGTSLHWAAADLGIFVEKVGTSRLSRMRLAFDGRTLKPWAFTCDSQGFAKEFDRIEGDDAPDLFICEFDPKTGLVEWNRKVEAYGRVKVVSKEDKVKSADEAFGKVAEMMQSGTVLVRDAVKKLGVTQPTLRRWINVEWKDRLQIVHGVIQWVR